MENDNIFGCLTRHRSLLVIILLFTSSCYESKDVACDDVVRHRSIESDGTEIRFCSTIVENGKVLMSHEIQGGVELLFVVEDSHSGEIFEIEQARDDLVYSTGRPACALLYLPKMSEYNLIYSQLTIGESGDPIFGRIDQKVCRAHIYESVDGMIESLEIQVDMVFSSENELPPSTPSERLSLVGNLDRVRVFRSDVGSEF